MINNKVDVRRIKTQEKTRFLRQMIMCNGLAYLLWVTVRMIFLLGNVPLATYETCRDLFMLQPSQVGYRPWSIFSYALVYIYDDFWLVIQCMLWLYFFGHIIIKLIGGRHLAILYVTSIPVLALGAIVASYTIPFFRERIEDITIATPRATMYALVTTAALYAPNKQEYLFFVPVRLKYIALFFVAHAWVLLSKYDDGLAQKSQLLLDILGALYGCMYGFMRKRRDKKPAQKRGGQDRKSLTNIDEIWEKMSRTGYDSLTAQEKERLFKQKDK